MLTMPVDPLGNPYWFMTSNGTTAVTRSSSPRWATGARNASAKTLAPSTAAVARSGFIPTITPSGMASSPSSTTAGDWRWARAVTPSLWPVGRPTGRHRTDVRRGATCPGPSVQTCA